MILSKISKCKTERGILWAQWWRYKGRTKNSFNYL